MEENKERQIEEIEALTSIYDRLFHLENDQKFSVEIEEKEGEVVVLTVTLNDSYPSDSPPTFSLSAPFLQPNQKQKLIGLLEGVYLENIGECVVFMWIEEIRNFLQNMKDDTSIPSNESNEFDIKETDLTKLVISPQPVTSIAHSKIYTTDVFEDRKSVFQGHCAKVTSLEEVKAVVSKLYENKKIAHATHNMYAYRIYNPDKKSWLQDCEDDGETAAGGRMLHLLEIVEATNIVVVVSRWYGGIQLGPDRFKHINNMTRRSLEESGFVNLDKSGKKKKK